MSIFSTTKKKKTFWFPNKMLNASPVVVIWWWQRSRDQSNSSPNTITNTRTHQDKFWHHIKDEQDDKQTANVPKPLTCSSYFQIPDQDFTVFLAFFPFACGRRVKAQPFGDGSDAITAIKHDKISTDRVKLEPKLVEFSM